MAYSAEARRRRRCAHVYPNDHARAGERCRAFAVWGTDGATEGRGLCSAHGGRTRGDSRRGQRLPGYECRTIALCRCAAYAWPHRPGGGLCQWPDLPRYRCKVEAGTHAWIRRPDVRWGWEPTTRRVVRVHPKPLGRGGDAQTETPIKPPESLNDL